MQKYSIEQLYTVFKSHPFITTDTRTLIENSIFFGLKGPHFNGNTFAKAALEKGCSFAVIDEPEFAESDKYIVVENSLNALQELASFHRSLLTIPVIGITGSNGKTTTKELIKCVLEKKYKVLATKGNLNNHIGVPITILGINDETEVAIIEMGANHKGEIASLCEIAKPDFGLITNIGKAHLEGFGSIEGVIEAKSELYNFIQKTNGNVFIHTDNELLMNLGKSLNLITYGTGKNCNTSGKLLNDSPYLSLKWRSNKDNESIDEKKELHTNLSGIYNFENILAAICVGNYFNLSSNDINEAVQSYRPSNNRSQIIKKSSNTIILDAYNANPTSMAAAIESFSKLDAENKLLVLGEMLELGAHSSEEHKTILNLLKEKKLKNIVLVGPQFKKDASGKSYHYFNNVEEAGKFIKSQKIKSSHILIKGSRANQLEKLVDLL